MQVNSINSYNTNFNGLHVSKQTLKAIGCTRKDLLNNPSIREAAEKYDVLVRAGNRDVEKYDPWYPMNTYFRTIGTSMLAGITGGIIGLLTGAATAGIFSFAPFVFIPAFGTLGLNFLYDRHKYKPVKEIVIQAGKGVDANEDYIRNCETNLHVIENPDGHLPNLTKEVKEAEKRAFNSKIRTYNTDDLFSAEKYLEALKKADIEILGGGAFFNRPIDKQGNTMLTQFFDVIPTEENQKEYGEILNILKNVKGINYNQKDGNGISCIEKIINSENIRVLPLICGMEFDYSPEIEILYNHIQDENFKKRLNNADIKFKFVDILQAVKLDAYQALTSLKYQLNSPLCDRHRLAEQIEKLLKNRRSRREYIHKYYSEFVDPKKYIPDVWVNKEI
jgi:hypothetical protein